MKMRVLLACAVLTAAAGFAVERRTAAQPALSVTYGPAGLQQISYRGVVLEDLAQNPSDAFHIWHMKMTDLNGKLLTSGQYGWGETNNGRQWEATSKTWVYPFTWGSIRVQFEQAGDTLNMRVTEVNAAGSGVVLSGAAIFPFVFHFPQLPVGFNNSSYPQLSYNTTGPSALGADFGSGMVAAVVPTANKPLFSGFMPTGQSNSYTPLISSTSPDGLATFQPHFDRSVLPGQTDIFTVSLRFAPSGTAVSSLAADAYQSWASTWPAKLRWNDRRIIGTAYLASSPSGDVTRPGGFPNNPRRYFNDGEASDFDVRTRDGLARFQRRVLDQAKATVQNLQRLNAQGVITWDIEGEEYPQETSYVCSPDQIATVAPEMESAVQDQQSLYAGLKLDDAYFKTIHDAGYRVGVCVRPQQFTKSANGQAQQTYLADSQVAAQLVRKMKYAHDRWGATIFYLDSTVEANGAVLNASIFQQAAAALPDSLLIPEEATPKFYAYTAPFKSFLFHGDQGTDTVVFSYYPHAFSANLVNDVAAATLAAAQVRLTDAVRHGDVLMVHADYWQQNNDTVLKIYADAGSAGAPPSPVAGPANPPPPPADPPAPVAPTPVPPAPGTPAPSSPATPSSMNLSIVQPSTGASLSGTVQVSAQLTISLDAAGSYLMVDGIEIGTRRVTDGPFVYPLDTTTLTNGAHTLQLWAHDTGNATVLSPPVAIIVNNATMSSLSQGKTVEHPSTAPSLNSSEPASRRDGGAGQTPVQLTYPSSGQVVAGTLQIAATITRALDAAGSYLLVDGSPFGWRHVNAPPFVYDLDTSLLSLGEHTLQVRAHTVGDETLLSNVAAISVAR